MMMASGASVRSALFLGAIGMLLTLLWIANLRYPLVSDPVEYAQLSVSIWETGTYRVLGVAHEVFPPMLPILSYPFIKMAGLNFGMKTASLVYGLLMIVALFTFLRHESRDDPVLAYSVTALLALSYTVTWLFSVGNADLLYGAEFFLILLLYLKAAHHPRLYLIIGLLLGITMLTRYMGAALAPILFLHVLLTRRAHLRTPSFWIQWVLAAAVFSLWLLRNKLTFGTWILWHLRAQIGDVTVTPALSLLVRNITFYVNPLHSIALLALLFIIGIATRWRKHLLIAIAIPWSIAPALVYHTASSRYLVATIPLLLVFVVEGIRVLRNYLPMWIVWSLVGIALVGQVGLTCLYTLPQCHRMMNQLIPMLPRETGIAQEAMESFQLAVDWIDRFAVSGSSVIGSNIVPQDIPVWQSSHRLRSDLMLAIEPSCTTVTYAMDQGHKRATGNVVYVTSTRPPVTVTRIEPQECHTH